MSRSVGFTLLIHLVTINALSLEKVSENKSAVKRDTAEFFPDWVPFKNKHGEQLGEFVAVSKKPKKRLAPPMNFVLRAMAEPEGDDYYDKGQGESDSEDYYEKKEWSDLNRPAEAVNGITPLNHSDISDIDGVVDIITKAKPNIVLNALQLLTKSNPEQNTKHDESSETKSKKNDEVEKSAEIAEKENNVLNQTKDTKPEVQKRYEDDVEYEDTPNVEKPKQETEEEEQEDNSKKESILDSVDELKERHAAEQKAISESVKEEEINKEEYERDNWRRGKKVADKYEKGKAKKEQDYDEYDEKETSVHEKYKVRKRPSTTPATTNLYKPSSKSENSGKLSVFKNPQLYMVYEDESEEITPKSTTETLKNPLKSSRYTASDAEEDNVRISLVPQDTAGNSGEPTLFFPKTRKNKKRRKNKTTTPEPDSFVAETIKETESKPTSSIDYPQSSGLDTSATGADGSVAVFPSRPSGVVDAVPASSDKKDKEKKPENYHSEKGGGREHHSEHFEKKSEHGKKAYEGVHKDSKTAKGHHDKEDHVGKYEDQGGHDKHHHKESGHYGDHHHEEHGKKQAKYEESGKHSKGHSTKGSHDIHKKEEYEKKVEFFEEEGDSAEEEKHGGFHNEKEHKAGQQYKKGNLKAGHHHALKGDSGHFHKGALNAGQKGHHKSEGHQEHGKHVKSKHDKEDKAAGKKWIYHHGYPAKTANLVVIDRRADQLYHGPQYYG